MLLGIYAWRLTNMCEVNLPEKIIDGLCIGDGRKEVWFVPAPYLRCCSYEGARELTRFTAKEFSERSSRWRKHLLLAVGCFLFGGWVFSATIL